MKIEIFNGKLTKKLVSDNPHKLYVFGDNDQRLGKGGQAIIRDENNTIGIRTKKKPNNLGSSFYKDNSYKDNCSKISEDILNIKAELLKGKTIVFSDKGYGNGLAKLPSVAPETYKYLNDQLRLNFGFNNQTGKRWNKLPGHDEIIKGSYVLLDNEKTIHPVNNSFFRKELLEKNYTKVSELIIKGEKVAFTQKNKYKLGEILLIRLSFIEEYLICMVTGSYPLSMVNKDNWSLFEGFNDTLYMTDDNYSQTHIKFVATLDKHGKLIFNNDIFSDDNIILKKKFETISQEAEEIDNFPEDESFWNKIKDKFKRNPIEYLLKKKNIKGVVTKVENISYRGHYNHERADYYKVTDGKITYIIKYKIGSFTNYIECLMKYDE